MQSSGPTEHLAAAIKHIQQIKYYQWLQYNSSFTKISFDLLITYRLTFEFCSVENKTEMLTK